TGGAGIDTVDYSDQSEGLQLSNDNVNLDGTYPYDWSGTGPTLILDNLHPDVEHMIGGAGNDGLTGGTGNDILEGGPGIDNLTGNGGSDKLDGGDGNDRICDVQCRSTDIDNGPDTIIGGPGQDFIMAAGDASTRETIDGGPDRDSIYGGPGPDVVTAGDGDDYIITAGGDDRIDAGAG